MTAELDQIIAEMRAGLEGATEGKWEWMIHDHSMASLGVGSDPGMGTPLVLSISPCRSCTERVKDGEWKWGRCSTPCEANAAHIARCSPDNIAAILNALSEATSRADAAELLSLENHNLAAGNKARATSMAIYIESTDGDLDAANRMLAPYIDRATKAEAERDAAVEALKPFAELAGEFADDDQRSKANDRPVWGYNDCNLTYGDFRRARSITAKEPT